MYKNQNANRNFRKPVHEVCAAQRPISRKTKIPIQISDEFAFNFACHDIKFTSVNNGFYPIDVEPKRISQTARRGAAALKRSRSQTAAQRQNSRPQTFRLCNKSVSAKESVLLEYLHVSCLVTSLRIRQWSLFKADTVIMKSTGWIKSWQAWIQC